MSCAHRTRRSLGAALIAALALQAGSAFAVVTNMYEFRVQKGATTDWWLDTFADGSPPPISPYNDAFSASPCQQSLPYTCYGVTGTFPAGSEDGGKLVLDSSLGGATSNALGDPRLNQRAQLTTNTDSANTISGLKRNHGFEVSGIFDLVVPADNSSGYGIRLEDRTPGYPTTDQVALFVIRDDGGATEIRLQDQNFVAATLATIDSMPITGAEGQRLRLFLTHAADIDVISGAYQFENGGVWGGRQTFADTATIFDGELWTRAAFNAFQAPIPEPRTYALMLAGLGLVGWQLRRAAARSAAQRIG